MKYLPSIDVRDLPSSREVTVTRDKGYFPVVVQTGPSKAVAVVRAGAGHIGLRGRLEVVRTEDSGLTWSQPVVAADSEWDDRNPSLGKTRRGDLVLAYHHQGNYDSDGNIVKGDRVDTLLTTSTDEGGTWSDPYPLNLEELRGRSPYGRMINYGDQLLMPIYGAEIGRKLPLDRPCRSYIIRSEDGGRTWKTPTEIASEMNETSLLPMPDGDIIAFLRSEKGHPASIYGSFSSDQGYKWSEPSRITADSEHPADALLLSNGWTLLCFGNRHHPYGVQGLVSTDGGKSWNGTRLIFTDDLPDTDIGYPSMTMFDNGRIMIMYYSRGIKSKYSGKGAFARAILFEEDELVSALQKSGAGK